MTREERLGRALDLALAMLIKHEPGDSRAVSNEFVALATVAAGIDNDSSWAVIDTALAMECIEP